MAHAWHSASAEFFTILPYRSVPFGAFISRPGVLYFAPLPMPTKTEKRDEKTETFESAMQQLEELVEAMEEEKLPLEKMLSSYEDGIRLAKLCSEKLAEAEKRIEIITRKANGETVLEEFEATSPPKSEPAELRKTAKSSPEDVSLF